MIDPDLMINCLEAVESAVHEAGWGQQPYLAQLLDLGNGLLLVEEIHPPLPEPPGESVLRLGEVFEGRPEYTCAITTAHPNLVGMYFFAEAYSVDDPDGSVNTSNYMSQPGLIMRREMIAVDIWGRIFATGRTRDEEPITQAAMFDGGRVPIGLTHIVRALARELPGSDITALDKLLATLDPAIDCDASTIS